MYSVILSSEKYKKNRNSVFIYEYSIVNDEKEFKTLEEARNYYDKEKKSLRKTLTAYGDSLSLGYISLYKKTNDGELEDDPILETYQNKKEIEKEFEIKIEY